MIDIMQIWKCEICGNIVEVIHKGNGTLVCCGKPMALMEKNSTEVSEEKHVPIIEGRVVRVGSVLHPMKDDHYIEWIEGIDKEGMATKKFLTPKDSPIVEFSFDVVKSRAYCNLHGLWA